MARTPLFSHLQRLARVAAVSRRSHVPATELLEMPSPARARRRFLQAATGAVAAGMAGCRSTTMDRQGSTKPRIVIVGGGLAGLNCAWHLKKAGVQAEIYEGSDRTGGRVFTKTGLLQEGQTLELGGSFIDDNHDDMKALATEFGLELLDMQADSSVRECAYHFGGRQYSDREVLDGLAPFVERMERDRAWLERDWASLRSDRVVREIDNTGIGEYLRRHGMDGWLRQLLEVAFVTEFGLDADSQSAFNLLDIIGLNTDADRWEAFGDSDERYKIVGGNQRVPDELAARLARQIHTGRQLLAVKQSGTSYTLSFHRGTVTQEIIADVVVLALPFTLLREVELHVELPAEKRRAINELGYGTNAKVIAGTSARPWRQQGFSGGAFSDQPFQLAWDNARMQEGEGAGITLYSGGEPGLRAGEGSPKSQVERLLPGYDAVFPGAAEAFNGRVFRMHWPSHAYTKGSYACYKPGQWTTVSGHEATPVGNLLFAGEHCSEDFQGFMNGAAESGRLAATEVLARVAG